jgi:hypothetical protein
VNKPAARVELAAASGVRSRGILTLGRPAVSLGLAMIAVTAVLAFGFDRLPGEMRDFEVYWTAAGRAAAGESLYRIGDGHYQFKYLPAFAVLIAPVAWLSLPMAKAAWFVISVGLIVTLVALAIAILPARRRPAWVLTTILLIAMGKFFGHELVLGQVNLLFGVIATSSILTMRSGSGAAGAILFVAAAAVKPYAVVFLPWIVLVRGRRALAAATAGLATLLVLPLLFYGPRGTVDLHRAWWTTVTTSTAPNLTNADNVSIAGMFAKWIGAGPAASLASLAVATVLLALALFVVSRRRGITHPEVLEGSLLLTLIPLLSPQGWDYVFLVATPAVALFANYDDRLPRTLRWITWTAVAAIGLSLFDIMGRDQYAAFMAWSIVTLCFIVLVSALTALRIRKI